MRQFHLKRWLLIVLALGVLSFSGTGGTFASFNAQTTNQGSSIASGTLTLSDQVNSGTACLSSSSSGGGSPTNNNNPSCGAILNLASIEPGQWSPSTQTATVTVKNTGSLNASALSVLAPSATDCYDTLTSAGSSLNFNAVPITVTGTALTLNQTGVSVSSGGFPNVAVNMTVSGLGIASGTTVSSVGGNSLTLSKAATATQSSDVLQFGASVASVTVTSGSASVSIASGSFPVVVGELVTGSGIPSGTVVASYSGGTSLTMSQSATSSAAETLTFGGSDFCQNVLMYLQEQSGSNYYCWYGLGSTGALTGQTESTYGGACVAPLSTTLNAQISSGTNPSSLTVAALTGPVYVGDSITVTNNTGVQQSFTALTPTAGTFYPPSTSPTTIKLNTTLDSSTTTTFGTTSTVVDSTTSGQLNSDLTDTLSGFDNLHASAGIQLYPITGAGTVSTTQPQTQLAAGSSRTFTIGLYLPNSAGTQNVLQGLQSTFGLTWYLSQ